MKGQFGSTAWLLEEMKKAPYETIFIIGAGVVENGWPAFREAIYRSLGTRDHDDAPIHAVARLTFFLRSLALAGKKDTPGYVARLNLLKEIRSKTVEVFTEFQSNKTLKLSINSSNDYVEQYRRGKTIIFTTNWDTLLGEYYYETRRFSVIYLHGNIKEGSGIYLPTEQAIEPYRGPDEVGAEFTKQAQRIFLEALEHAKRVVVWGCSLDVYDAELCMLIGETHIPSTVNREYIVIDPSHLPVDRLRSLIGGGKIKHVVPKAKFSKGLFSWLMQLRKKRD